MGRNNGAVVLAMVVSLIFISGSTVRSQGQKKDCGSAFFYGVWFSCKDILSPDGPQLPPTSDHDCCFQIQAAGDPSCFCEQFANADGIIFSLKKWIYTAKFCKNPLKPGTKCGNYTVPG